MIRKKRKKRQSQGEGVVFGELGGNVRLYY